MARNSDCKIYVGNLPYSVDDKGLIGIFLKYNPTEAHVVFGPDGRSKGFGFVTVNTADDVRQACEEFDGTEYGGRRLKVSEAHKRDGQESRGSNNSRHFRTRNRDQDVDPEFEVDPNFGRGSHAKNRGSSRNKDDEIDPEFEVDSKHGIKGGRGHSDDEIDPEFEVDTESGGNQGKGCRKDGNGRYY